MYKADYAIANSEQCFFDILRNKLTQQNYLISKTFLYQNFTKFGQTFKISTYLFIRNNPVFRNRIQHPHKLKHQLVQKSPLPSQFFQLLWLIFPMYRPPVLLPLGNRLEFLLPPGLLQGYPHGERHQPFHLVSAKRFFHGVKAVVQED